MRWATEAAASFPSIVTMRRFDMPASWGVNGRRRRPSHSNSELQGAYSGDATRETSVAERPLGSASPLAVETRAARPPGRSVPHRVDEPGSAFDREPRRVGPEPLEIVELPRLAAEHVGHHVSVVDETQRPPE